jgi:hypothetical protein
VRPLMANRDGSGRRRNARGRRAPAPFIGVCALGEKSQPMPDTVGRGMGSGGSGDVRVRGPSMAVLSLVGRCKSVCSARGCAACGNGGLGVNVGAGPWDRRSQRLSGTALRVP